MNPKTSITIDADGTVEVDTIDYDAETGDDEDLKWAGIDVSDSDAPAYEDIERTPLNGGEASC